MLKIGGNEAPGWKPVMASDGDWMVAITNADCSSSPRHFRELGKHPNGDEVFVLLKGKASLLLGGTGKGAGRIRIIPLRPGVVYNVCRGAWHKLITYRNARVLIVEKKTIRGKKLFLSEKTLTVLRKKL